MACSGRFIFVGMFNGLMASRLQLTMLSLDPQNLSCFADVSAARRLHLPSGVPSVGKEKGTCMVSQTPQKINGSTRREHAPP